MQCIHQISDHILCLLDNNVDYLHSRHPTEEKKVIQINNRINNLHREKHNKHIDHHLIEKFCSKFDQIDKQHPMIHNNYKFHFQLKSFHSIDKINDLHHKYIYMDNMMNHLNHNKHP